MRRDDRRNRRCVASGLDDNDVLRRKTASKLFQKIAPDIDAAYPPQFAVFPSHGFRKDAVNIKSNDAHALSLVTLSSIRGACGRHDIY